MIPKLALSLLDPQSVVKVLGYLQDRVLTGVPGYVSAVELAAPYLAMPGKAPEKLDKLMNAEMLRSASVGFATGLGGLLALPFSLPGNLAANYFIQLRLATAAAIICGLDPTQPASRALALVCLTGKDARATLQQVGLSFFVLPKDEATSKINDAVAAKVAEAVSKRIVTKLGEKGAALFGRAIPLFGGFVSAGVDAAATRAVGQTAKDVFLHVVPGS